MGIIEMRSSQVRGALADLRSALQLRLDPPEVAYLGWTRRGNLGDEAIYTAHERSGLGSLRPYPANRFQKIVQDNGSTRAILLGGGTLVGRPDWLPRIDRIIRSFPDTLRFATGIGVEDSSFSGQRSYTSEEDMHAWVRKLSDFDSVSVRGPMSADILEQYGVESRVVGDPALLLACPREGTQSGPVSHPTVGINIARVEDSWGGNMDQYASELRAVVQSLTRSGVKCRLLSMTREDHNLARTFAKSLGNVEVYAYRDSVDATLKAISECCVVIGPRLHLCILAAAVGVPFLSVMYKPKCLDFAMSVGMEDWVLRSDSFSAAQAGELLMNLESNYQALQEDLSVRVEALQDELRSEIRRNRGLIEDASL